MKFGPVPVREAEGATAVHSVRTPDGVVKKGTRIGAAEIAALERAGIKEIVIARLEAGDVGEDDAAAALARAVAGDSIFIEDAFTGRANLYAKSAGVLVVDRAAVDALNRVDEAVTLATLPEFRPVQEGEMVATVKIIPFAISQDVYQASLAAARPLISVAPYRVKRVALVSTQLPGLAPKVIEKTVRVTAERLKPAGAAIVSDQRVPHEPAALKRAIDEALRGGAELVIVFGASAIADRRDVIPSAIVAAGGAIEHFGMPVDPGNLMLLGTIGATPVIGAPGCARSPKENGFDWLLARLLAKLPVKRDDVTALGVGGLLMEIVTRPQPREGAAAAEPPRKVAALVLAAGRGTRMGGPNKLLEEIGGKPIVRWAVEAAAASRARPVVVVTGHEGDRVAAALKGLDFQRVHNPDFAEGLSTSLKAGLAALPADIDAVAVTLGDMPEVTGALIDRLAQAIDPARGMLIAVPTREGRRGNPVVWTRRFFDELKHLEGDVGARHLIAQHNESVVEVPVEDEGAFRDIDTPEALQAARAEHAKV
ncbi:MAG: molybdopterin-binding/glycosyltransferase family 2 protein [Bradyrhizobiaceae bacterium]|nr:molybdopterin-binding/glycosyltransferase family 2 protein [Bradyrhizobiaceae bacterium]